MKKFLSALLVFITIFTLTIPIFALESNTYNNSYSDEKIYLNDGTYITITLIQEDYNQTITTRTSTYTRSGSKVVENRTDDGELIWQYRLTGEFSVNEGISATCINATYTQSIYDGYWHFSNGNAYAENNVAHGLGTFKKKVLFITTNTYNIDISITCDAYGNLS